MKVPLLGTRVDERFLHHRLRSTSAAGVTGGIVALGLFLYRLNADGVWSWDLLAVGVTIAVTKVAALVWLRLTD